MKFSHIDLATINWDLNAAWRWPVCVRVFVIAISSLFIGLICFYYDTQPQLNQLQALRQNEIQLKSLFETKQSQTGDISNLQAQLNLTQSQWLSVINTMSKEENASTLLNAISQMGIHYNLEFKSLQLMPKVTAPTMIVDEFPIHIEVMGKYSELFAFLRELEQMPTLVTLHDLTISSPGTLQTHKFNDRLLMSLLIKTYRQSENLSENARKNVAQ